MFVHIHLVVLPFTNSRRHSAAKTTLQNDAQQEGYDARSRAGYGHVFVSITGGLAVYRPNSYRSTH